MLEEDWRLDDEEEEGKLLFDPVPGARAKGFCEEATSLRIAIGTVLRGPEGRDGGGR